MHNEGVGVAGCVEGFYSKRELLALTGLSARQLKRYRQRGLLPPPIGGDRYACYPASALTILRRIRDEVHDSKVSLREFRERLDYEKTR